MTTAPDGRRPHDERAWWRHAVVYQVYPRSFADADGDGMGDLPGLIGRLDHLTDLGVDAIWVSPFYPSPLNDGGYDVADYRGVDPRLGTLADVDALIARAHERGIRVLLDLVPNHTSSEHPWFAELLAADPGSPEWDRYLVRPGRGPDRADPPNNWRSVFHGEGWSPVTTPDGRPTGYWYLHLFDTTQPDLNWENPQVRAEFRSILRFWFDRGVDGFRIDVAHGLVKQAGLPDFAYPPADSEPALFGADEAHAPFWDQDGVHDIYREWRAVADEYYPPRVFCGETWVPNPERFARYQRPDELHTSFNFTYLEAGWDAVAMRTAIDATIANHALVGAPPTWVLSNHDVVRHRTRLAPRDPVTGDLDLASGLRRARAATAFTMALPGSMYLYQGEELGLPEVLDLPDAVRQDPAWRRSGGTDGRRDGCRVPIPWSGSVPSYGFGAGSASWLPQPSSWARLSVAAQVGVEGSTLEFYRAALGTRRAEAALGDGPLVWLDAPAGVLAFRRPGDPGVTCVLNLGAAPALLPAGWGVDVLLASGPDVAEVTVGDGAMLGATATPGPAAALAAGDLATGALAIGAETAVWLRA